MGLNLRNRWCKLRWTIPHQPAAGFQVSLNGTLMGFTPTQTFALRGLDPNVSYTAEVRTVWQDGKLSEKKASLQFTLKNPIRRKCFFPISIRFV